MSRALVHVAPGRAEIRPLPLGEGEAVLRMRVSALSRGTERLVFEGRVPESEHSRMRAPFQKGDFPFPVAYGYCAVAEVEAGPEDWLGRRVFALHPHQTRFRLPIHALNPLPDDLPTERAALAANMETALNVVWDARIGPGDRVLVVGAGLVGCLVAALAARIPGAQVTLSDLDPGRAALARKLGCAFAAPPAPSESLSGPRLGDLAGTQDVAINASASGAGLAMGLAALGVEGRLVEASWHGRGDVAAPLGGAFHSRRLSILSSQVGRIPADRAARWDFRRRMGAALRLLAEDARLDALFGAEVAFQDLPARLPALLAPDGPGPGVLVRYPQDGGEDRPE